MATNIKFLTDGKDGKVFYPYTHINCVLTDDGTLNDLLGVNTAASIASVAVDKNLVIATISANASFALASVPSSGREVHVIVKNSGSSNITITIPNSGNYINCGADTINIAASSYGEVNCVSDGSKVYVRAASK